MNKEHNNTNDCETKWLLDMNKSVCQVYRLTLTPTPDGNYILPSTTVCGDLVFYLALLMTMATGTCTDTQTQLERMNDLLWPKAAIVLHVACMHGTMERLGLMPLLDPGFKVVGS
jgi:hypothetical protein